MFYVNTMQSRMQVLMTIEDDNALFLAYVNTLVPARDLRQDFILHFCFLFVLVLIWHGIIEVSAQHNLGNSMSTQPCSVCHFQGLDVENVLNAILGKDWPNSGNFHNITLKQRISVFSLKYHIMVYFSGIPSISLLSFSETQVQI